MWSSVILHYVCVWGESLTELLTISAKLADPGIHTHTHAHAHAGLCLPSSGISGAYSHWWLVYINYGAMDSSSHTCAASISQPNHSFRLFLV